jgi:hypothetical protein
MEPVNSTVIVKLQASVPRILPGASVPIMISFGLNVETLELDADIIDVEVEYYPEGLALQDFYALTEGSLAISGTVRGGMSRQESFFVKHDPEDMLPFEAAFSIERVLGTPGLLELPGR